MNPIQSQELKDELSRAELEAAQVAERIAGLKERLRDADGWRCIGTSREVHGCAIRFDYLEARDTIGEAKGRCISDGATEYIFDLVWVTENASTERSSLEVFVKGEHDIKPGTRFWVKL